MLVLFLHLFCITIFTIYYCELNVIRDIIFLTFCLPLSQKSKVGLWTIHNHNVLDYT